MPVSRSARTMPLSRSRRSCAPPAAGSPIEVNEWPAPIGLIRPPRSAVRRTTSCSSPIEVGDSTVTSAPAVPAQFVHLVTRPMMSWTLVQVKA